MSSSSLASFVGLEPAELNVGRRSNPQRSGQQQGHRCRRLAIFGLTVLRA